VEEENAASGAKTKRGALISRDSRCRALRSANRLAAGGRQWASPLDLLPPAAALSGTRATRAQRALAKSGTAPCLAGLPLLPTALPNRMHISASKAWLAKRSGPFCAGVTGEFSSFARSSVYSM
jgi:hypothetical protein